MADILPFKKSNQQARLTNTPSKGSTLCRQGHHKWVVLSGQKFDVKQGRLVTASRCSRCGKRKVEAL